MSSMYDTYMYLNVLKKSTDWDDNIVYRRYGGDNRLS